MIREIKYRAVCLQGAAIVASLFAIFACLTVLAPPGFADDEFQDLVDRIPRSANAVVLLNMEKAKSSPMGIKEDWKAEIDEAFESGVSRVPPEATRFVLASHIDFEFMEPIWEAAVIELNVLLASTEIEKRRHGELDTIEGLPAILRPNDTYIVKLAPKIVGAMSPANRQTVVRWIRDTRKSPPPPLSPYLQKAAVYSDRAGSEIIMAIDLDGVFSFERLGKYLKSKQKQLDEWGADLMQLTKLLEGVQGVRIGVRIGEEPSGMIVVDVEGDAAIVSAYAKPLLLEILAERGGAINDLYSWTAKAEGREISLSGKLSKTGMRRLMSIVNSPASEVPTADSQASQISPGELPAIQAKASLKHFRAVTQMAEELKEDMRDAKNLASTSLWFDKYAKRIERLPTLNVDPQLLNYSAFVANHLRQASLAVKTMGIQSGVREGQVTSGSVNPYGAYPYPGTRWGGYGYYGGYGTGTYYGDQTAGLKAAGEERLAIRAEEKGIAATDIQKLRQEIIAATADIRRKMTDKFQMQF
ncbi:MAG: hypothetical protein GX594_16865 [Pirellulaceae bacterium]|nr:hypothetical protein [Pirellulaceae bacterium]